MQPFSLVYRGKIFHSDMATLYLKLFTYYTQPQRRGSFSRLPGSTVKASLAASLQQVRQKKRCSGSFGKFKTPQETATLQSLIPHWPAPLTQQPKTRWPHQASCHLVTTVQHLHFCRKMLNITFSGPYPLVCTKIHISVSRGRMQTVRVQGLGGHLDQS